MPYTHWRLASRLHADDRRLWEVEQVPHGMVHEPMPCHVPFLLCAARLASLGNT
jgi:hypothetical protein